MTTYHIPPMTHELSRYWDQPPSGEVEAIAIDDTYTLMPAATLAKFRRYDCSIPSGEYAGKAWITRFRGVDFLRWLDESALHTREVLTC